MSINKSICNLDDVISSIQASSQTQEQKIASLEVLSNNVEQFASDVARIDGSVAELIANNMDAFYDKYSYLKPDSWLEEFWDDIKSGFADAVEWCKEHWKLIAAAILVVLAIVLICTGIGGVFAPLLAMIAKGLIVGAVIGGVAGGTVSTLTGGSFFEGFENGAFSGAISGAITCGLSSGLSGVGQATMTLGKTMLYGAVAETGASLLSDLGDITIKGDKLSAGDVLFNAGSSFVLGGAFAFGAHGLGKRLPNIIPGINTGRGSWAHVWATQATKAFRYGTKMSTKTILKGIGSKIIEEVWDYFIEPFKSLADEWIQREIQPQK